MATDKKISELTAATALTGAEILEIVQGGANKQTTTQDIADLGGGAVDSVNGQTGVVVLDAGDVGADPAGTAAAAVAGLAPLASPTFTGVPVAPTAAAGTNTTQIATTAFVITEIGSLATMTYRTETATHDLDATDLASIAAGDQLTIILNNAVALDLEIPTNANQAFPVGTIIGWAQMGAGQVTIVPLSGVTLRSPNAANKSFAQYSKGYIEKLATNEWLLSGDITV